MSFWLLLCSQRFNLLHNMCSGFLQASQCVHFLPCWLLRCFYGLAYMYSMPSGQLLGGNGLNGLQSVRDWLYFGCRFDGMLVVRSGLRQRLQWARAAREYCGWSGCSGRLLHPGT